MMKERERGDTVFSIIVVLSQRRSLATQSVVMPQFVPLLQNLVGLIQDKMYLVPGIN